MELRDVPDLGDVVWLQLHPQVGREQAGRRPALVLSPAGYNGKVGLAVCCPITSRIKGYPFEVVLPENLPVHGVVLADQIKSLDWRGRNSEYITTVDHEVMKEVLAKVSSLLSLE